MTEYGELVLVLGDLHIPHRKEELPNAFQDILVPGRVAHVLCTGNVGSKEAVDFVRSLSPSVHIVRGDIDGAVVSDIPDHKVVRIGEFTFCLYHGHQFVPWGDANLLINTCRASDCDVLIHGHTHQTQVWKEEQMQKLILNPGSLTGAYSPFNTAVVPSFLLLAIKGSTLTVYVYEAKGTELRVSKTEFSKAAK